MLMPRKLIVMIAMLQQIDNQIEPVGEGLAPPEKPGAVFLDTPPLLCYTEINNKKGGGLHDNGIFGFCYVNFHDPYICGI